MTYPIAVGELKWGGEYSYVHRTDRFDNPQSILPATDSKIREQNAAAFISYALTWQKLSAEIGLRYEHVDFDYYDKGIFCVSGSKVDFTVGAVNRSGEMGNFFVGQISGIAVYNRALDGEEMRYLSSNILSDR